MKLDSTLEPPSGFELGTTGLEIQCLNHKATAHIDGQPSQVHKFIFALKTFSNKESFISMSTFCHN